MASIHDVATMILSRYDRPITTMKLQKLAYFAQEWSFALRGCELFPEEFLAYRNGPVNYDLFDLHRGQFTVHAWPRGKRARLNPEEQIVVDAVLHTYGELSGKTLGDFTHEPGTAWSAIREEHGIPQGASSTLVIPKDYIRARAPRVPPTD